MNLVQKVVNRITQSFKSVGGGSKWDNLQESFSNSFSELFGEKFGVKSGYLTRSAQRTAYTNNGNFSRVINNVIDGIVSLPIRSESDDTPIDKEFLRSAIGDFLMGSGWVSPTSPVGAMFQNKPSLIKLEAFRDSEMDIVFNSENEPSYYTRKQNTSTQPIQINKTFDTSSTDTQVLHVFQSNSFVTKQESYRGVGNAATEGFVLRASQNRDEAEANFLENKGISMILTNKSNIPLRPDQEKEINEANRRKIGGAAKFGGINLINADLSAIKTSTDAQDLKLLETGISHLQKISSIFRLDSILFGDKSKSTYNNVSAAKVGAYTDCYIPIFEEFIAPVNNYIGSDYKVFKEEIEILQFAKMEVKQKEIAIIKELLILELITIEDAKERINSL